MANFLLLISIVTFASAAFVDEMSKGSVVAANQATHPADVGKKAAKDSDDFARFPDKSIGPQRGYTLSEVAERDGNDGRPIFLVVDGKVYDVTDFADFHPAGPEPIKNHAGQDATAAMKASGMSPQVYQLIKRFQVGWVVDKMADIKRYTMAEVAQNKGKNGQSLLIVYKDSVYDLTKYLAEHPGGVDSITEEAGTDATKAFDESAHTPDAKIIMAKYKIGELVEEEKRYDVNGKKKKKVVQAAPEGSTRSCVSIITCGLMG